MSKDKWIQADYKPASTLSVEEIRTLGLNHLDFEKTHQKDQRGNYIIDEQVIFSILEEGLTPERPEVLFQTIFTPEEYVRSLGRLSSCNLKLHKDLQEITSSVDYIPQDIKTKVECPF
jgi:hypothetical protein